MYIVTLIKSSIKVPDETAALKVAKPQGSTGICLHFFAGILDSTVGAGII